MSDPDIRDLSVTPARAHERKTGLLAFVDFSYGRLRIEGVTIRRTRAGCYALAFPRRRDASGRSHNWVRPLDQDARDELTRQVLDALGLPERGGTSAPGERGAP